MPSDSANQMLTSEQHVSGEQTLILTKDGEREREREREREGPTDLQWKHGSWLAKDWTRGCPRWTSLTQRGQTDGHAPPVSQKNTQIIIIMAYSPCWTSLTQAGQKQMVMHHLCHTTTHSLNR